MIENSSGAGCLAASAADQRGVMCRRLANGLTGRRLGARARRRRRSGQRALRQRTGGALAAGGGWRAAPLRQPRSRTHAHSNNQQRRSGVGKAMPRSRHEAGDWSAKRAGLSRPDAVSVCNARTQRDGALPTYSISRRSGMVGFLGSSQTQSNDQRGPGQRRQQKK